MLLVFLSNKKMKRSYIFTADFMNPLKLVNIIEDLVHKSVLRYKIVLILTYATWGISC